MAGDPAGWEEVRQAATEQPNRPKPWVLETFYEGQPWQTLVDSGSSVSMVHSSLLPSLPTIRATCIACFHGHTETCAVVRIQLYYLGQLRELEIAWVKHLYHTLLGRDAPAFQGLVALFLSGPSHHLAAPAAGGLAPRDDQPGPSNNPHPQRPGSLAQVLADRKQPKKETPPWCTFDASSR